MTTKVGVLAAVLVCTCVASCGGATGKEAITAGWDSGVSIDFVPRVVSATRYPVICGVANPPFTNGDLFELDIVGADTTGGPDNAFSFSFASPAPPLSAPIMLSVLPFMAQGTGVVSTLSGQTTWYPFQRAAAGGVKFVYTQGTDPGEIDTGAFDAVIPTLTQLPTKDGAPLAVRLQIHFVDGRELDHTFSSPLTTETAGCPKP